MSKFSTLEIGKLDQLTVDDICAINAKLRNFDEELLKETEKLAATYSKFREEQKTELEKLAKNNAAIINNKYYAIQQTYHQYSGEINYRLFLTKEELPADSQDRVFLYLLIAHNYEKLKGFKFKLANLILRIFGIKLF